MEEEYELKGYQLWPECSNNGGVFLHEVLFFGFRLAQVLPSTVQPILRRNILLRTCHFYLSSFAQQVQAIKLHFNNERICAPLQHDGALDDSYAHDLH